MSTVIQPQPSRPVPMPNVLLVGDSGSGKTTAIRTIVEAGLETFVIFTEPMMDLLADLPADKLHWRYIPPTTGSWDETLQKLEMMAPLAWDAISKMTNDPLKSKYTQWYNFVHTFAHFHCDRTGQDYGDVTEWGYDRALVIDGLSGVNKLALQFICGSSVAKTLPQWGAAIDLEMGLVAEKLCFDTTCLYVLIAHLDFNKDELTGAIKFVPNALGKANGPELPKSFNDTVHAIRDGQKFRWSTTTYNVDVKGRNLPMADNLPPHFGYLLSAWQKRVFPQS